MTLAELSSYDGKNGRRAYIAVNSTIYDVTDSPRWGNGLHHPNHQAGQDLTEELAKAPHVRAVVERFPVIGRLEEDVPTKTQGGGQLAIGMIIALAIVAIVIFLLL